MCEKLEAGFHQAMLDIYHVGAKRGHRATYFLRMVNDHGGVAAAQRLLAAPEPQAGLSSLWELDLLDYSMEALVLEPRWAELFTDAERKAARYRLDQHKS